MFVKKLWQNCETENLKDLFILKFFYCEKSFVESETPNIDDLPSIFGVGGVN